MGNISALIILVFSFFVPLMSPTVKCDKKLLFAAWLTLAFRHGIALINAFVSPISLTWGDLYMFHQMGAGQVPFGGQAYGELLGFIYKILGVSFWLGEVASILTYSFSLLVFVEIAALLGIHNKLAGCILLFGCMPSPAVHCSVTLRESYQVFGFLGSAYALLRLRARPTFWVWPLLVLSLYCLVIMHQSLAVFAIAVLAIGVPWASQGRGQGVAVSCILLITLGPMFAPLMLRALESDSPTVQAINEGSILNYAAKYRTYVAAARSDYNVSIDQDSLASFTATASTVVVMYFLAPLPWQVSSTMDYYAFFEVVVRLALIYGCIRQIAAADKEMRQRRLFLFIMAMGLEFMWALGTTNWGTALRHHVVAFGAFVLVGLPHFSSFTLDPALAGLLRRRERRKKLQAA